MFPNADAPPTDDSAAVADLGLLSPISAGTSAESRTGDEAVLRAMLRAEAALLRALVATGIAPASAEHAAATVASADIDTRALARDAVSGGNPVISLVRQLRELVGGEAAAWVHYGATSQDIVDTALALVARDVARQLTADLTRLGDSLVTITERYRSTPAVARTLTQQALPTTVGMRTAGWLAGVHDAARAIRDNAVLPVSLGGPVGTSATYAARGPAVLDAFAGELDLPAPVSAWHTRRAPVLNLAGALTLTCQSCGKLANDVLVLSQTEIAEVREATGGSSSAMPHKANPAQSVLIASAARTIPSLGSSIGGSGSAEQERPAGAWHAEWQPLRQMLRLAGACAERTAEVADGLRFDTDASAANVRLLLQNLGRDRTWLDEITAPTAVWIDRILAQHQEEFA